MLPWIRINPRTAPSFPRSYVIPRVPTCSHVFPRRRLGPSRLDPKAQDVRRSGELREQDLQPAAGHNA